MIKKIDKVPLLRAMAFFDGKNFQLHAQEAYRIPDLECDVHHLFSTICRQRGWQNNGARFYIGMPDAKREPHLYQRMQDRNNNMEASGVRVVTTQWQYGVERFSRPDGGYDCVEKPKEKAVDVSLAVEVVLAATKQEFDVAVIFSQDNDFMVLKDYVAQIARDQNREINIFSAFPTSVSAEHPTYGIKNMKVIKIDFRTYSNSLTQPYTPKKDFSKKVKKKGKNACPQNKEQEVKRPKGQKNNRDRDCDLS